MLHTTDEGGYRVVLDVIIDKDSLTIPVPDPFNADIEDLADKIEKFTSSRGAGSARLDLRGLIPKMIRGIAGCEKGCPADAKKLVSRGVKDFELEYIEGGILSARAVIENERFLYLKIFPDF